MGNYTQFVYIQDDVMAGVAVLAAKGPYSIMKAIIIFSFFASKRHYIEIF